ncbi:MAG: undecaprenyldiphospho-muramoylpentapeptide beta-N-acetylglucosaminyltransferase [Prevotellaceae bacterium]|jgi:UDP-N-acetylglucosamine--N-acetylmuramyl-(pentapeptide) pyrophosphoryl-undecaprenol N-acetylglucosamine transferase|nr:undecaprenyldiphospho-muramoylpentapeptide beta-N-acetylglucosaminyltransferase [Prevotellaceae bacterium]
MKFLISGGGTGGHIFPAISIANALREIQPDCEMLFIGAIGRLEMTRVPDAGYNIIGLEVRGLERKKIWKNFTVLLTFINSYFKAKQIVKNFAPDVAIGVGGYVSAASVWAASALKVPVLLQEQNSFAGVANKFLAKHASKICVAYNGMEKFFSKDKIVFTGNPVRKLKIEKLKPAYDFFGFSENKKTLLIIGGSLGAKTINESILTEIEKLQNADIQVIWQTGKDYFESIKQKISNFKFQISNLFVSDFISRMDFAYSIADLVISRAGASSISELCLLKKPAILVPSPNVAENHQYHNAMALAEKNAAILIEDKNAVKNLVNKALDTIFDKEKLTVLEKNIATIAVENSADTIAKEVIKLKK